ncbi:MAG: acetolactate synthase small subunit [Pseudomonadota bacterium]|nr:acetolactate synthase small subunit [Pseudomonadota bacterium]
MRHIISILLQNESGALARVAGLFSSRGYNIESLSVAPTDDPAVSRLTLVTTGTDQVINQINKQISKLIDVVDRVELTRRGHVERELLLVKVRFVVTSKDRMTELLERYKAEVVDQADGLRVIEMTGTGIEVDDFLRELREFVEIHEVVRSGVAAIASGDQILALRQTA